ncbi:MAG: S41 family peptidase [Bacteroidales bacterium]|nr:S41 family peptidase [Bacteroidales bacterium]MBK8884671.1 S41 family peptidase [Bacteroidales bacterium]
MNYNNNKKSILLPVLLAVALAIGILIGKFLPAGDDLPQHSNIRSRNDKLNSILNIIESNYVDSVNRDDLVEAAIPAVLKKLDPHSVYIPAKDLARANEPLQGNFEGIGISFNMVTDTILVISTIPGGPSEKMGLLPGDKILYVNDSLVAGKHISDEQVMGMLKGPKGTVVKIKILRNGEKELLPFDIIRDKIPIYSIDVSYMVNDNTGYIKINNFAMTTFEEFMKGLRDLKEQGMTSLIVDLRGNSGGIMEAAIQIANQFLKEDELIVYTKGRAQPRNEARATGKGEFETGNLVVLIDEWSASASEILAGAIQDNDRGTIIGRRSFGKGLVQEPISFADGSGLRLTIARYYTPTGRSIQKPYTHGFDEYFDDLTERYQRGEFEVPDSIHFSDSLKFTTPGGRIVYGGGGIMPDNFVPVDTSGVSPYFVKTRSLIYRFALKYTENNREVLKKFTAARELEKYLDTQPLTNQFVQYASAGNIKMDREGLKTSGEIINTQIKAYIARNMLDNKGFYPIWEKIDTTLLYAIDFLKK